MSEPLQAGSPHALRACLTDASARTARCWRSRPCAVVAGVFVVAGGDRTPPLEIAERALDHVASGLDLRVEDWGPVTGAALDLAPGDLVTLLGDDYCDPLAVPGLRVDVLQATAVVAGSPRPGRRSAAPITANPVDHAQVHLGAPPAWGATQGMTLGLRPQILVIRQRRLPHRADRPCRSAHAPGAGVPARGCRPGAPGLPARPQGRRGFRGTRHPPGARSWSPSWPPGTTSASVLSRAPADRVR